jgi:hypothetical protein
VEVSHPATPPRSDSGASVTCRLGRLDWPALVYLKETRNLEGERVGSNVRPDDASLVRLVRGTVALVG